MSGSFNKKRILETSRTPWFPNDLAGSFLIRIRDYRHDPATTANQNKASDRAVVEILEAADPALVGRRYSLYYGIIEEAAYKGLDTQKQGLHDRSEERRSQLIAACNGQQVQDEDCDLDNIRTLLLTMFTQGVSEEDMPVVRMSCTVKAGKEKAVIEDGVAKVIRPIYRNDVFGPA